MAEPGRTEPSQAGLGRTEPSQAGPTPKTKPAYLRIPFKNEPKAVRYLSPTKPIRTEKCQTEPRRAELEAIHLLNFAKTKVFAMSCTLPYPLKIYQCFTMSSTTLLYKLVTRLSKTSILWCHGKHGFYMSQKHTFLL